MKLEFQQLRKRYGQKEALRGVSITLSEGVYGLLGPNGAGKSTLMNILAGNLQADSGRILFCGEDIRRTGSDFPARLGYMPQQQTLYPGFTVERFLYYMASLRGMKRGDAAARIDWALGCSRSMSIGASASAVSPAECASGSCWRRRFSPTRRCSCSTSRRRGSTRSSVSPCAT